MPSPYNLEVEYNCSECRVRADRLFCNMGDSAVEALDSVKFTGLYPTREIETFFVWNHATNLADFKAGL